MNDLFEDLEKTVLHLREIITEIPKRYDQDTKALRQSELESTDLSHLMELTSFNCYEGWELAKEMQSNLQKRREIKDEIELLSPVIDVIKIIHDQHRKKLDKSLGELRKVKVQQSKRRYRIRARHDLKERFDKKGVHVV